jgi:hypothetical protein
MVRKLLTQAPPRDPLNGVRTRRRRALRPAHAGRSLVNMTIRLAFRLKMQLTFGIILNLFSVTWLPVGNGWDR